MNDYDYEPDDDYIDYDDYDDYIDYDDYEELSWDDYEKFDSWPEYDTSLFSRFKRLINSVKYWINEKLGKYDDIPF